MLLQCDPTSPVSHSLPPNEDIWRVGRGHLLTWQLLDEPTHFSISLVNQTTPSTCSAECIALPLVHAGLRFSVQHWKAGDVPQGARLGSNQTATTSDLVNTTHTCRLFFKGIKINVRNRPLSLYGNRYITHQSPTFFSVISSLLLTQTGRALTNPVRIVIQRSSIELMNGAWAYRSRHSTIWQIDRHVDRIRSI